jgi:hypothetical protein
MSARNSIITLASAITLVLFSSWVKLESGLWFTGERRITFTYYDKYGDFAGVAVANVTKVLSRSDTVFSESEVKWRHDSAGDVFAVGKFMFARDSVSFIAELDNLVPPKLIYDNTTDVKVIGRPLIYPLRPKKNTPLPGTSGSMTYTRPAGNTTMVYELTDRMVEIRDTITTKAGIFPCWIITSTERIGPRQRKKDVKVDPTVKERRVKEWFSPEYGIVKAEYSIEGRVEQVRVLTGIE